jgi:hypothetical protein
MPNMAWESIVSVLTGTRLGDYIQQLANRCRLRGIGCKSTGPLGIFVVWFVTGGGLSIIGGLVLVRSVDRPCRGVFRLARRGFVLGRGQGYLQE